MITFPRGPWFLPLWLVVGILLDCAVWFGASISLMLVMHPAGGQLAFTILIIPALATIWFVHAAIMPSLAIGRVNGRQLVKLFGLGIAFVAFGSVAAWLGSTFAGVLGYTILNAIRSLFASVSGSGFDNSRAGFSIVLTWTAAVRGAVAGAVLHPFLNTVLPRRSWVALWMNVIGGAFAGAVPSLLTPYIAGGGSSHVATTVAFVLFLAVSMLPHLWFVGRAVRRAELPAIEEFSSRRPEMGGVDGIPGRRTKRRPV